MLGAGETSELLLRYLCKHPHHKLTVCNRGMERGLSLADRFNADFFELNQLDNKLADYDLIFTATSSETPIITLKMVADALKARKHKPMVIIDIAIPRDTESNIRKFDDVFYYTVDDLQKVISQNLKSRQQAAMNAQSIIDSESEVFDSWIKAQQHKNLIHQFQRETAKIRKASLEKALKQLNNGSDPEEVLYFLANNLTNKLNHTPVKALSEVIHSGDVNKINFLKKIMKLDDKDKTNDPRD
jgi:glutamyl-tRNA reductase